MEQSWLDGCTWVRARHFPCLPSVLDFSQAELGKRCGQLQCFLQAAHIFACGLSGHIFTTTFAIHQARHLLYPLVGFQAPIGCILEENISK